MRPSIKVGGLFVFSKSNFGTGLSLCDTKYGIIKIRVKIAGRSKGEGNDGTQGLPRSPGTRTLYYRMGEKFLEEGKKGL
ncbi:MAG: hypothetical protein IMW83_07585 [Caldanaerobacter subterraneus]|nr:hypothetical protein [Caldanaerobacter subterraneus]